MKREETAWFVPPEIMGSVWAELESPALNETQRGELLGRLKSCRIVTAEIKEEVKTHVVG